MVTLLFKRFCKEYFKWDEKIFNDIGIILDEKKIDEYNKYQDFLKKNKSIIRINRIHAWFYFPVVVIHELLHYFFALIFFCNPKNISFSIDESGCFRASVEHDVEQCHPVKMIIIAGSPVLLPAFAVISSFFTLYFLILVAYIVLSHPYVLPSYVDIGLIKGALKQLGEKRDKVKN